MQLDYDWINIIANNINFDKLSIIKYYSKYLCETYHNINDKIYNDYPFYNNLGVNNYDDFLEAYKKAYDYLANFHDYYESIIYRHDYMDQNIEIITAFLNNGLNVQEGFNKFIDKLLTFTKYTPIEEKYYDIPNIIELFSNYGAEITFSKEHLINLEKYDKEIVDKVRNFFHL
jgi:hypothetical protein